MQVTNNRKTDNPIDPLFLNRWSTRAYDGAPMAKEDLLSMIEAARWAPSAYNIQPWRFIYVERTDPNWDATIALLDPFNASWGKDASAAIFLLSDTLVNVPDSDDTRPSGYHSFDAGSAWAQLGLQAHLLGYSAHAVAGLYHDKVKERFNVPDRFKVEIAILVGKRTTPEKLPEALQERETPSPRVAFDQIAFEGSFSHE
ncbi:nitroreductase family protein [Terasakiella pusilla]|uniref:nitroreductase family protein n=1 Tax=Terasakiella pusilla TaxID=64973 RepID=UPI003AA9D9AA